MKNHKIVTRSVIVAIALASLALSGCATVGNQSLKDETEQSVATKITEGKTTKADVREQFGSPGRTTFTDGGLEVWSFDLTHMSADGISYVPIVGLFAGSTSGTKKELVVMFDAASIVKRYSMSESPISMKTGLAK
jgi:outer membrane protein assembly factor BamE (lipoprotein component of BamABCDE complex)